MKHILQQNQQITSNSPQLALLKQQFPQCFDQYGAFMPHKLQEVVQASGLALSTEGYSLNWLGKSYARLLANLNVQTFLQADTAHNSKPGNQNSQNMLIKGDNLEVLKHLSAAYRESVKMIYIDPPYNTGSDGFVYQDDRKFTAAQLVQMTGMGEEEARRILEFTQSKSNSHSAWLTFMYPRLYVARRLLRDDGVIFISIDDNEQAQLKLLCDEVFGEENFVAQFPWRKRTAKSDVPFGVSQDFEWIFCYAKASFLAGIAHERKYYQTPDFPSDRWRLADLTTQRSAEERPNCAYEMINPKNLERYAFNPKRTWGVAKDNFDEYYEKGKIVFPNDYDFLNTKIPAYRVFESEDQAKALRKYGDSASVKAASTHLPKEVGLSENGNKDIVDLFGAKLFSFPKPVTLIKHFLDIVNNSEEDCLILDFFAGSGTTAHAVMQLNAEDNGNRRYICVQLDEATDPKSEAHKAGYHSIYDITAERIQRAAAKIRSEHNTNQLTLQEQPDRPLDLGFQQFSTIPVFDGYLDPIDLNPQFNLFDPSNLSNQDRQNLMLTWQAADAIPLTQALSPVPLGDYTAYLGTANSGSRYLYALDPHLNLAAIVVLLERLDHDPTFSVQYLVTLGYALDSTAQREISEAIHHYQNRKGIELKFDIRF